MPLTTGFGVLPFNLKKLLIVFMQLHGVLLSQVYLILWLFVWSYDNTKTSVQICTNSSCMISHQDDIMIVIFVWIPHWQQFLQ